MFTRQGFFARCFFALAALFVGMTAIVARGQPSFTRQLQPPLQAEVKKNAVPDADSQDKASKLLHEIYNDKLSAATSPSAQIALARELLDKVPEIRNDPPSRFVLLREAGSLAFKAHDYALSLEIVDVMDEVFEVDSLGMRIKLINAEDKNAETPAADRCSLALRLMVEAYAKRRLDVVARMGELSKKAAEESRDPALLKAVDQCRTHVEALLAAEKAETDLLAKQSESPEDPETNLALGKLYCFERGDWEKGLPMLALGSDAALKQLAKTEMNAPSDSESQLKLGDDWWNLAQNGAQREKMALLARSAYWYRLAQSGLTGLSKVKAEKRLAEIGSTSAAVKLQTKELLEDFSSFSRRAPVLRPLVLFANGGSNQSERAATSALSWLANHQNSDGSWSLQHYNVNCISGDKSCTGAGTDGADTGATAMGLLPFLAAGQTHKSKGPYKDRISRAVLWLQRNQQADGCLAAPTGNQMMYSHGLATIALSEAYGLSGDKQVGQAAQRAVNFIIKAQNQRTGGWRYHPGETGDTSVFGWQLMALKSARMAGLTVGDDVFRQTSKWLDSVSLRDGTEYCYVPGERSKDTMTAVGLLCRQYLGAKRDSPRLIGGIDYLMKNLPDENQKNVYYWYYATQVMHNMNNREWDAWNRKMRTLLVNTQCHDDTCAKGSWDPAGDAWSHYGGRVMQTALSALTLEVYYRYQPVYDKNLAARK